MWESHCQGGGGGSNQSALTYHLRWGHQLSVSYLWGRITGLQQYLVQCLYVKYRPDKGAERCGGTKADLLIILVQVEGSHCWPGTDPSARRAGVLALKLTGSRVSQDTLFRKTSSSPTMQIFNLLSGSFHNFLSKSFHAKLLRILQCGSYCSDLWKRIFGKGIENGMCFLSVSLRAFLGVQSEARVK